MEKRLIEWGFELRDRPNEPFYCIDYNSKTGNYLFHLVVQDHPNKQDGWIMFLGVKGLAKDGFNTATYFVGKHLSIEFVESFLITAKDKYKELLRTDEWI